MKEIYPGLVERLKALFGDVIIIAVLMAMVTTIFEEMEEVSKNFRMFAFIGIVYLYDPVMTILFGGTLGHILSGLKVIQDNESRKNILPLAAILRTTAKYFLGLISVLIVSNNSKGKAIHDFIGNSVLVYRKKRMVKIMEEPSSKTKND